MILENIRTFFYLSHCSLSSFPWGFSLLQVVHCKFFLFVSISGHKSENPQAQNYLGRKKLKPEGTIHQGQFNKLGCLIG